MHKEFHVLVNAKSGTASKLGSDKIAHSLKSSGLNVKSFNFLESEQFNQKLIDLLDSDVPVLVGGGDGTIAKCAALHLPKKKPFAILPFGTMNLLAQDLNVPLSFPENLSAYRNSKTIVIDVGTVNDHPFLCCAAWGTMPESAVLREENRDLPQAILLPRLTAFIIQQMNKTQRRKIKLILDNKQYSLRTSMLVISNNAYNPDPNQEPFKKETLQDGILGIYSIRPPSLFDKVRLLFHITRGDWVADPAVRQDYAREVRLYTKRAEELISIDGEPQKLSTPLNFKLHPGALKIIVPTSSPKEA